jgi:hypothetical protein
MITTEIKQFVEQRPFRPFGIRLTNGAKYTFKEPRDVGARKDFRTLVYFGEGEQGLVLISTNDIVEVFDKL